MGVFTFDSNVTLYMCRIHKNLKTQFMLMYIFTSWFIFHLHLLCTWCKISNLTNPIKKHVKNVISCTFVTVILKTGIWGICIFISNSHFNHISNTNSYKNNVMQKILTIEIYEINWFQVISISLQKMFKVTLG